MCVGFGVYSYSYQTITKTKQYQATVGVPFVLDPIIDIGFTHEDLYSMTGMLKLYNDDSYSPSDFIYTIATYISRYVDDSQRRAHGEYYTITPQKSGTSTFHIKVTIGERLRIYGGGFTTWVASTDTYDIQYTIYTVDVTKITIPKNMSLTVGESYTFSPVIEHNLAQATLTWSTEDASVASVDNTGKVTAVGAGTTNIICTAQNGVSAQCKITVKPIPAESITLNATEKEIAVGNRFQLQATILPEAGTSKTLKWESTDEATASVNSRGEVTAINTGTCTITATTTDGTGLSANCEVTVINNYLYAKTKKVVAGSRVRWPVWMRNEAGITAVQFDIVLPSGVSIVKNDKGNPMVTKSIRCEDHEIGISSRGNNTYRILLYSVGSELIAYDDGQLVEFALSVGKTMTAGDVDIQITNVVLTTPDQTKYQPSDTYATLTVMDTLPGDVNMDGSVDVVDIVAMATYILSKDTATDYPQADVNGDGNLDVTDIVCIANIILDDPIPGGGNHEGVEVKETGEDW